MINYPKPTEQEKQECEFRVRSEIKLIVSVSKGYSVFCITVRVGHRLPYSYTEEVIKSEYTMHSRPHYRSIMLPEEARNRT